MANANAPSSILLVDDDRLILTVIRHGLSEAGYQVATAQNADESMAAVQTKRPDLVILDVLMPGRSGLQLGRQLRSELDVPFIFLSASGKEDAVREAAEIGAISYLVKPIEVARLIPAVQAALARAAEIRQLREVEAQLSTALQQGREVSMAIGLLMERLRVDREAAHEVLREEARTQRRKMNEVANDLLRCAEQLNLGTTGAPRARR